jgi:hypothetical protein
MILYECQAYNTSPIVSKCCPEGYIIQESSDVTNDGYCVPYNSNRNKNLHWHPKFKTDIIEDIPISKSQVMESMLDHCSSENIISLEISGNEKINAEDDVLQVSEDIILLLHRVCILYNYVMCVVNNFLLEGYFNYKK